MVSVVMATFNGEKYIIEQVESICNQSQKPDEVIICDDCSTDNTVTIIENYVKHQKLKNWKIIRNEKNLGYYDNFFKAISLAKGDTIYLADQDDIWDVKKIETFETLYKNPDISMVQSNIEYIDDNGNVLMHKELYHGIKPTDKMVFLTTQAMCKFQGSGFTMSFRKCIADSIFENELHLNKEVFRFHDILIGLMSIARGKCVLATTIKDKHRLHENNVTRMKGKRYVGDRTKHKQLIILERRINEFVLILPSCNKEDKREIFMNFKKFAILRKSYIEKFSINKLVALLKYKNMYSSRLGIVTDTMYSIGCEKVLLFMFRISSK